jgi:hypothetical protein
MTTADAATTLPLTTDSRQVYEPSSVFTNTNPLLTVTKSEPELTAAAPSPSLAASMTSDAATSVAAASTGPTADVSEHGLRGRASIKETTAKPSRATNREYAESARPPGSYMNIAVDPVKARADRVSYHHWKAATHNDGVRYLYSNRERLISSDREVYDASVVA